MINLFCAIFVLSSLNIQAGHCILGYHDIKANAPRFMVLLLEGYTWQNDPNVKYNNTWSCGGVLVTSSHVLTSAACVQDVYLIYAIVGSFTYSEHLDKHNCTRNSKKRIVKTCVPVPYKLERGVERWAAMDIAVATVDSPYLLANDSYYMQLGCPFAPDTINLNFDKSLESPNTTGTLFGRGSMGLASISWRFSYYNGVAYTNITLMDKAECKKYWPDSIGQIIEKYNMLCSPDGHGFCKNDHGGPLVTYKADGELVVTGIMSAYRVNATINRCAGPFLYTSVAAHQDFLKCVLKDHIGGKGRRNCPQNKDFKIVTTNHEKPPEPST